VNQTYRTVCFVLKGFVVIVKLLWCYCRVIWSYCWVIWSYFIPSDTLAS